MLKDRLKDYWADKETRWLGIGLLALFLLTVIVIIGLRNTASPPSHCAATASP